MGEEQAQGRAEPGESARADQAHTEAVIRQEVDEAVDRAEAELKEELKRIQRVFVAVHGIGDQFRYATIQSVANRLSKFLDVPVPVPLGSFHSKTAEDCGFLFLKHPPYPERFRDIGLAEIYWADIPREVQKEGYQLEEAKRWASSLVARMRMRSSGVATDRDYEMLEQVIGEMIEGIAVLDRLLFLASKATTFRFDLKNLLDSFLGDVQIVTDFEAERAKLLGQFRAVMDKVHKANPDVDIYIVAHSEGTVVAFLGLLQAFTRYEPASPGREEQYGWVKQIRGLMTIGSPIEEHLILWPELWDPYELGKDGKPRFRWRPESAERRIEWRNYLDNGDPIAYPLKATRDWIHRNGWGHVFEFEKLDPKAPDRHQFVFSRYLFPGKAHTDYWDDPGVFGHFLATVVDRSRDGAPGAAQPGKPAGAGELPPELRRYQQPPGDRWFNKIASRILPYFIPLALIVAAVYILYRAVHGFHPPDPKDVDSSYYVAKDVTAISLLMIGVTVASRVPRLTRSWWAQSVAFVIFLLCALAYPVLASQHTRNWLGGWTEPLLLGSTAVGAHKHFSAPAIGLLVVAIVLVLAAMRVSAAFPRLGAKPLIGLGSLVVVYTLFRGILGTYKADKDVGPVWPVLLAGAAFLYLWWLAIILFDLIYVWHHYIRGSFRNATAVDHLRAICKDPSGPTNA